MIVTGCELGIPKPGSHFEDAYVDSLESHAGGVVVERIVG